MWLMEELWHHWAWSSLVPAMAWCLMVPGHYLDQWHVHTYKIPICLEAITWTQAVLRPIKIHKNEYLHDLKNENPPFWKMTHVNTVKTLWKGQECHTKVMKLGSFPYTFLYKSCLFYPSWQATSFERPPSCVAFREGFHCIWQFLPVTYE